MPILDLSIVGKKFERVTVVCSKGTANGRQTVLGRCDCGKEFVVFAKDLKSGNTKSCGCLALEIRRSIHTTHGESSLAKRSHEYSVWIDAKKRCYNPRQTAFKHYGGRGIRMCERWLNSFPNFLSDMGRCPPGLTLERTDFNGDYSPENCEWVTQKDQCNNKRSNRFLELDGVSMTMARWADKTGIGVGTIWYRLKLGWPTRDALTIKPKTARSKSELDVLRKEIEGHV